MSTDTGSTRDRSLPPANGWAVDAPDPTSERRGRTFAHVDLQPWPLDLSSGGSRPSGPASSGGMHRPPLEFIERTVRSGDRVCPYGVSRIVVAFGPDAEAVAPNVLGGDGRKQIEALVDYVLMLGAPGQTAQATPVPTTAAAPSAQP